MIDKIRAQDYISNLYRYVLDRRIVSDGERVFWTERLLQEQDPISIFNSFVQSEENRIRLEQSDDSRTEFRSGHFYSPVPSRKELIADADRLYGNRDLRAVDLNDKVQQETLSRLIPYFYTIPFVDQKGDAFRYYYDNTS